MKYSAKQYARAIIGAKKFNAANFFRALEKNGDTKKLKEITVLVEKMLLAKTGNKKITLETARPLQKEIRVGKKGDVVEEKINPDLIAGMKIMVDGERQLDFSLLKKLNEIFT